MTQPIQDIIDKIVADSLKDIGNALECTDTAASEHYTHGIHAMTYPKLEKPDRGRKYPSRCTPTFTRITYAQLRDRYYYDPENGELRYRHDGFKFYKDTQAWWYGNGPENRLKMVYFNGLNHHHSRLVWYYHNGVMPREVLHLDKNRLNDRIENLQDADHSTIMRNAPPRTTQRTMSNDDFFAYQLDQAQDQDQDQDQDQEQDRQDTATPEPVILDAGIVAPVIVNEPEEIADPIADIDAAIFHRSCDKPWTLVLFRNEKVSADCGDFYTLGEAYAVWRRVRNK